MKHIILLTVLTLTSTPAFALVHANFLLGNRSIKLKNPADSTEVKFSGVEYALGAYVDPIPLVPVGFGLTLFLSEPDDKSEVKDLRLFMVNPEIIAWVPFKLVGLKPYAKLGYTIGQLRLDSTTQVEGRSVELNKVLVKGVHANVGVKWAAPSFGLVSIIAEVDFGFEKSNIDDFKAASASDRQAVAQTIERKENFTNVGYHIGVEVGF